jgi:hypothetical protein
MKNKWMFTFRAENLWENVWKIHNSEHKAMLKSE